MHYQLRGGTLARLFGRDTGTVRAVDGVNLTLHEGEVLGLVGESGSGKTTLGRALLGLVDATRGAIRFHREPGEVVDLTTSSGRALRSLRTDLQMVFQDPHAALNPSMDIETAVGHPLKIHGLARGDELRRRVVEALERVGLSPADQFLSKYPSDLSGGQKQRAVLARAAILEPELMVADEPISMLDMSVRAKILELMLDAQARPRADLRLHHPRPGDREVLLRPGRDHVPRPDRGDRADRGDLRRPQAPLHPGADARRSPSPTPTASLPRDLPRGEIPDAASPPLGCSFHPRCPVAVEQCGWESRDLRTLLETHWTRRDAEVYEREQAVIGDLDRLDEPQSQVTISDGAHAAGRPRDPRGDPPRGPRRAVLARAWATSRSPRTGCASSSSTGVDPALRRAGGVEVACVLHGDDPASTPGG